MGIARWYILRYLHTAANGSPVVSSADVGADDRTRGKGVEMIYICHCETVHFDVCGEGDFVSFSCLTCRFEHKLGWKSDKYGGGRFIDVL